MPSHLDSIFWSFFHRFLPPTSIRWALKFIVFPIEKQCFFKKSLFEVGIDFCSILVPTWLHFASKNPPKSFQKSIPRCITFSIDFCIVFSSIWLRFWRPTWSHVGHFFYQKSAALTDGWVFFVGSVFFSVFWVSWLLLGALWARFGRVRASILEVFGTHLLQNFQVFCTHFFSNLSPMLKHFLH